ncbi:MAG: tetratricopeptide repeat protein [Proteobacteria bacterium]|nr:tetratricopeptide repeat protein [Pseudomonadota bacterium]
MPKRKISKELELIEPGKIAALWQQIQAVVVEHYLQVAAVGLIVVVIAGGIGLWRFQKARADEQSLALFYNALERYNSHESKPGKKETPPPREEVYKQSLEEFKKIIQQYPGAQGGEVALFYAGASSYDLGKDDEALTYYQDFIKKLRADSPYNSLRPAAYEGIGYVYERKGDYKTALEWFEKQRDDKQSALNMMACLNLARCYTALSERDKACRSYKEFIDKYPSSSFAEMARIGVTETCLKVSK